MNELLCCEKNIIKQIFSNYSVIENDENLIELLSEYSINSTDNPRKTIYDMMKKNYANETVIKSEFIKNYLSKVKTAITIFELPIGNSRIDLCKVNGKSVAYEIKTDYDTPSRLSSQLDDYDQVFEEIYIICSSNNVEKFSKYINNRVGIISYHIYNNKYIFKEERKSKIKNILNSKYQLNCMQTKELKTYFKHLCFKKNISKNELIQQILEKESNEKINKIFKLALKNRYKNNWNIFLQNISNINELDYQWFYKSMLSPKFIYNI